MGIAEIVPLADSWGMHDGDVGVGWVILMVPMMLLMVGGMIWMMRGMRGSSVTSDSSSPGERPGTTESPVEILQRRFAEGEISIEEYRARRRALLDGTAETHTSHEDQPLTAGRAGDQGSRG